VVAEASKGMNSPFFTT